MFHLTETLSAYQARDPAARSKLEVFLLYPGVHATMYHQAAHFCYCHKMKFLARTISQWSRFWTGIEIHPGAKIGRRLVIVGGTGKDQGKRHPTIGNNVLLSTGSKVLGPFKVGDGARIAANAVVLKEVPEDATAVGVPARVVRIAGEKTNFVGDVDQVSVPDPVQKELDAINSRLSWLEEYLDKKHEEEENKRKEKQQDEAV